MDNKQLANKLRRILKSRVDYETTTYGYFCTPRIDHQSTLLFWRASIMTLADVLDPPKDLPATAEEASAGKTTGPVQVREEVVGTSSKAKNKNMGNSGFSGGELAAA